MINKRIVRATLVAAVFAGFAASITNPTSAMAQHGRPTPGRQLTPAPPQKQRTGALPPPRSRNTAAEPPRVVQPPPPPPRQTVPPPKKQQAQPRHEDPARAAFRRAVCVRGLRDICVMEEGGVAQHTYPPGRSCVK